MRKINNILTDSNNFLQIISTIGKMPKSLYIIGNLPQHRLPAVAIVGTRKPTAYGREVCYKLAYNLTKQGLVIISGLALGIDALAHRAALDAGGITLAILPGYPSVIHPRTNIRLAKEIIEKGGALLSEYESGQPIYKQNFLARNRIVSGLSDGVIIVEAASRSGTLATAAYGLEQGKSVMAVPGNITSPMSEGCNRLISKGARLISSAQDVLEELNLAKIQLKQARLPLANNREEQCLLELIASGIRDGEALWQKSKLEPALFAQTLTMLEIQGKIKALGANQWGI